jgi:hypothetical protein
MGGTGVIANDCEETSTAKSPSKKDIGGTGHANKESMQIATKNSGIGGTGHAEGDGGIGGTGIVGTINGFGSIWVNGLEVQYDDSTVVADNELKVNPKNLAIGQLVTIEASGIDKTIKAKKITVVEAVTGKITSIDEKKGLLKVLGQEVIVNSKTQVHDQQSRQNINQLKQGDFIKVSGLRLEAGQIAATYIERMEKISENNIVGPITNINGNTIEIYGMQIATSEPTKLHLGQEVLVSGKMNGDALVASVITPSPATQLFEKNRKISLQGYVGSSMKSGQIKIGNIEIMLPNSAEAKNTNEMKSGELVQVSGRISSDNRIIAERIDINRDRPENSQSNINSEQKPNAQLKVEHMEKINRIERRERLDFIDHPERPDSPNRSGSIDHDDVR